jgi:hypothetical protein
MHIISHQVICTERRRLSSPALSGVFHRRPRGGLSPKIFKGYRMARRRPSSDMHIAWLTEHAVYQGDACLTYPFWRSPQGYGVVYIGVPIRRTGAHRLMCRLAHGAPAEETLEAAHECGKGHLGCVNPKHLSWKTHSANVRDTVAHGMHNTRGERHGRARLSEADVVRIREAVAIGKMMKDLAREYGVHRSTISLAASGKNWSHLARAA